MASFKGPDFPVKILAVEDDAVARAVLRKALQRLGHESIEAPDGEAAWQKLQSEDVRVVVSDWMMPRSDGLDLCRRIRAGRGKDYTYFILLTSRDATEENQRAAADAGVDDFLTKPLDLPELWTRLRVAERIKSRSRDEWRLLLEGSDVCFAPVLSLAEAAQHPHQQARGNFVSVDGHLQPSPAPRFSRSQLRNPQAGPAPGADTQALLESLGMTAQQIGLLTQPDQAR